MMTIYGFARLAADVIRDGGVLTTEPLALDVAHPDADLAGPESGRLGVSLRYDPATGLGAARTTKGGSFLDIVRFEVRPTRASEGPDEDRHVASVFRLREAMVEFAAAEFGDLPVGAR